MDPFTSPLNQVPYRVLSLRTIFFAAILIVLIGVGVAIWLLAAFGSGGDQQRNQLEAIKTAGTIVVGTGGAAALLLAARRQRSTEIALKHQELVAATTEADATARRITELYTTAVEQLGSDKAPVRLGGLYALERLAQDNPHQRQTIVNVLCAYLRMPYDAAAEPSVEQRQELEVRLAAQRLLFNHLQSGAITFFWAGMYLDLTGATLVDFQLAGCTVDRATFQNATFVGSTDFDGTVFTHATNFSGATFDGEIPDEVAGV
jgi:hypothetical protein